jgi:hypothetical protein
MTIRLLLLSTIFTKLEVKSVVKVYPFQACFACLKAHLGILPKQAFLAFGVAMILRLESPKR